jgi:hypothetical protein
MSDSPDGLPEWSEDELSLWKSAANDRPPAGAIGKTLRAVGVGGALATVTGTATTAAAGTSSAAKLGALGLLKWSGIVMLGGAAVVGGRVAYVHFGSTRPAPSALQAPNANPAPAAVPVPAVRPMQEPAAASPDDGKLDFAPEPRAKSVASQAPARASSERASQPDIGREIRSIDEARSALRRGDSAEALKAIDRYGAEHGKKGSLGMEATVLRIEALLRGGDRAQGVRLANSFLAKHPKSPYAPRIRALLQNERP